MRHLQSPEECLASEGYKVRYLGQTVGPVPSAIYRATDPQGEEWRVAVNYISARREFTNSCCPRGVVVAMGALKRLSMIERITPWELPEDAAEDFDITVWRTLNLLPLMRCADSHNSAYETLELKG
ncbi:MAG: hypothetical protein U1F42_03400 [Candidatus Competibacteraceae bacterium]